jgi:hypothetical protein
MALECLQGYHDHDSRQITHSFFIGPPPKKTTREETLTQPAAPASTLIKIITGVIFGLMGFFVILGLSEPVMLGAAAFIGALLYACYLYAPVKYEIRDQTLTVHRRINQKEFTGVTGCTIPDTPFPKALRIWGNGGLFSFSGRFWNRPWGTFYAYVTHHRHPFLLLVGTRKGKVLISPLHPGQFLSIKT